MNRPALAFLLLLLGLLGLSGQAGAAGLTPAGTVITNQGFAGYLTPEGGTATLANSNVVQTTVRAVCAVSVTPDGTVSQPGQSATLLPGEQAVFKYVLVNAGNDTLTFPVSAQPVSGSTTTPTLRVVNDLNGSGLADPNEPEVSRVTLPQDGLANLLLIVQVSDTPDAPGNALVNLVSGCADGAQADSNNVSLVKVGSPPVLNVVKTFTPSLVKPGTETTVNVTVTNTGQGASREVTLTDPLADQGSQGLTFVSGSASTNLGTLEYTTDGTIWTAAETSSVRGLRVRLPSLAPGQSLTLAFRMLATPSAENKVIPNTAVASTGGKTVSGTASADVRYQPGVAIGPVGQPLAPEGTADDLQSRPFAVVGQAVCFDHTVKNTGDVTDAFRVTITYPQGGASAVLSGADGQPLAQPLVLSPGQEALVRVCYTPTQTGPLEALLTVTGDRGTSNTTRDLVQQVESGLPELKKTYQATTLDPSNQPVTLPDGASVAVGDTVTYTLTVHNPYTRLLTNVVITDPLPAHLDFVSASDGGSVSGLAGAQTVTWNLETLAPGETRTLGIASRVSLRAVDGEALKNTFRLVSAELTSPLPSNETQTPVWTAKLLVQKTVSATQVTYGDRLTYTVKITNQSATTAIVDTVVTDTPNPALTYIAGSSTLDGQAIPDPVSQNGTLVWTVAELPAGATRVLTYQIRVGPQARGQLVNTVTAVGTGAGGLARALGSNRAQAQVLLNPLGFAPVGDIVGLVFIDRNRNGLFDPLLDTPVPSARVLLAGGRQVITDAQGRYSFPNVPYGPWALRLDPNTTPYPPLQVPPEGGLIGTQTVFVRGLTSVDFPLAPLSGDIETIRDTSLVIGDVQVVKTVYLIDGAYVVTLKVNTPRALQDALLQDPLPEGATLLDGQNTFSGTLRAGVTTFTYRFAWTGEPRAATTDPSLTWRAEP